ncbi:MAG: hypothetical protein JWN43_4791 [Gammaproteobacteria bacterium]|nr:hypothetical protein [Gammaproteobacteria bacterium]
MFGRLAENRANGFVAAFLHCVPSGLGVPAGDRQKDAGMSDLAVQARSPGARRPLEDLAHPQPRRSVLLRSVIWFDVNLENELHLCTTRTFQRPDITDSSARPSRLRR